MRTWILAWAVAVLAAGCAQPPLQPPSSPDALFRDAEFKAPSAPVRSADVFKVSPAMRGFLERESARMKRQGGPTALVDGLVASGVLKLDYDSEVTRNAAEAFDAHSGNCLSLVIMTAALAKEAGLQVVYRKVDTDGVWSRSGNLLMQLAHVNVSIAPAQTAYPPAFGVFQDDWVTIDFVPDTPTTRSRTWLLEERRIVAMYLVNRAVELMAAGRLDDAYWHVRAAIASDPGFVEPYNTLGVLYSRRGLAHDAVAALRFTLALDPAHRHALGNLAGVLEALDRPDEAALLRAEMRRLDAIPPFKDYDDGLRAMQAGDYEGARRLFERELRRHGLRFHELHLNLARIYLHFGEESKARDQLEKALEASTTRQQQSLYAAKLDLLGSSKAQARRP